MSKNIERLITDLEDANYACGDFRFYEESDSERVRLKSLEKKTREICIKLIAAIDMEVKNEND